MRIEKVRSRKGEIVSLYSWAGFLNWAVVQFYIYIWLHFCHGIVLGCGCVYVCVCCVGGCCVKTNRKQAVFVRPRADLWNSSVFNTLSALFVQFSDGWCYCSVVVVVIFVFRIRIRIAGLLDRLCYRYNMRHSAQLFYRTQLNAFIYVRHQIAATISRVRFAIHHISFLVQVFCNINLFG